MWPQMWHDLSMVVLFFDVKLTYNFIRIIADQQRVSNPHLRQRLNFCNCRAVRLAISIKFDVFRMVRNHEIALV